MKKTLISFNKTNQFASLVDDYLSGDPKLDAFYDLPPSAESFKTIIEHRSAFGCNRNVLQDAILQQYGKLLVADEPAGKKVSAALALLTDENTFTVTTGHQLNIFTGSLYTIYKIMTTIKLAGQLKELYPDKHFVPVFWMATEDHDFEEINNVRIYGNKIIWNRESKGPAGRLNMEGMASVLDEVNEHISGFPELMKIFRESYDETGNLSFANRKLIHQLFGEFGLVIIDGDDSKLKKLFIEEMKIDILENRAFHAINTTSEKLNENYKVQVQPREINLFYITDTSRNRIVKDENGTYEILDTGKVFSREELLAELDLHPEKFSPNVVLRPLYQEKILPNLAYIGGPGELNYWLQYKLMFEKYGIPFPLVFLRNCMLVIDKNTSGKVQKLGLEVKDFFQSADYLMLKILEESSNIHINTDAAAVVIRNAYAVLSEQFGKLDASLVSTVEAEKQKALNGLNQLEEKGRRALKRKNENLLSQLKNLKEKLFPGGGLQERQDNFAPFYINYGRAFLYEILEQTDPFVKEFIILTEE